MENIVAEKRNEEFKEDNWNYLNDIESLMNRSYIKKVRCVVFDIKI